MILEGVVDKCQIVKLVVLVRVFLIVVISIIMTDILILLWRLWIARL